MDKLSAIDTLNALAQPTRMAAFRHLVANYPETMPAGELARLLNVPHNSLSTHLSILARARLVAATRDGRLVLYRAEMEPVRDLVAFLTRDCCGGRPEICEPLVEQLTRSSHPVEATMNDKVHNVLFLCTGNSARSIIAESILNRLGMGRFRAFSAGSMPKGEVNPHAIALLKRMNFDTSGCRSKSWEEFLADGAPQMDFVFTVCDDAAEACPVFPGQPMSAHWGIEDPASATGSASEIGYAFSEAFRMLNARISVFTSLPMAALDRLSLQRRLKEIGRQEGATTKAGADA